MSATLFRTLISASAIVFLAIRAPAVEPSSSNDSTNSVQTDIVASSLLQLQAQLHDTVLALQENQQSAAALDKNNSDLLAAHIQELEQTLTSQRASEADDAHRTLEWTLLLIGVIGLAALGILSWMVYLQSRAFAKLTEISVQQNAVFTNANAVHQFAAPARAVVENSNARLLEAVGQLKDRVSELEHGLPSLANGSKPNGTSHGDGTAHGVAIANGNGNGNGKAKEDMLAEGQKFLDENAPRQALEIFDGYLAGHPDDPEALLKKADALQKIGRNDEALTYYNQVIAADNTLAVAHLQKGGLLNRLRRYDEALNCYEQALQAQEKKRR
jgi:tetratricopeptide (TPR) repeat protein